jgi:uncharacterized protein YndB with AHSA1/START domain
MAIPIVDRTGSQTARGDFRLGLLDLECRRVRPADQTSITESRSSPGTALALHYEEMEVPAMSAGVFADPDTQPAGSIQYAFPSITTSVSIQANRQRLLQTLTVAEYMETWLSIPGTSPDSHLAVASSPDRFRIDHFRSQQVDFSITGIYRTCRRSKLQFTWDKETKYAKSKSLVLIRLQGDFGKTIVSLMHTQLSSDADHIWHRNLWERSLLRLRSLF